MAKAVAQITITDLNDAIISGQEPANPTNGTLWIKKNTPPNPDELFQWDGAQWVAQSLSLASLDPNQNDKLESAKEVADNLDQVVVPALDQRVGDSELRLDQTETTLTLKADKTTVNALTNTVSDIQTNITVQAGEIATKVEQKDYDDLNARVTDHQTSIEQLNDSISQKVEYTDYNELTNQVSIQETSILQTASDVTILSTKSDDHDNRITTAEASIVTQAGQIALKADQSSLDTLTGRVTTAETTITQHTNSINLKADASSVYTKSETDNKLGTKVDTSVYNSKIAEINLTTDGISQRVSDTEGTVDTATGNITVLQTDVSTLEQTATQIQTTISGIQTDVDGIDGRLTSAETQVTQNKNDIALTAKQTDLNALTGRVTTAEGSITTQAGQIALKADSSDVDTKLATKVDTQTYNNKMAQIQVTTDGISQDVSDIQGTVDTQTGQITQLNSDVSAVDQKADSIQSSVTSLTTTVNSQGQTITSQGTSITQLNNTIALKADASNVYTKAQADGATSTAIDSAKAEIKLTTDAISSSVASLQTTTSDHESRLVSQQTTVEQLSDQISQKVEYTDYDQLNQQMSVQETQILQTSSDITLLANRTTQAEGRLDVAEASIQLNSDSIETKVDQTDFDTLQGTVTSQGTSITQLNNSIALKAEASNVYTKSQTDSMVNAKVDVSTYNDKMAQIQVTTDGITSNVSSITNQVNNMSIGGRNLLIEKTITNGFYMNDTNTLVANAGSFYSDFIPVTAGKQYTFSSNGKSAIRRIAQFDSNKTFISRYLQQSGNVYVYTIPANVSYIKFSSDGDANGYVTGYFKIEAGNMATAWTIAPEDTDGKIAQVSSDVSAVDQKANSIQSSVTSLTNTVTSQGNTITSQGTSITQLNNSIALKANSTDVYTKTQADAITGAKVDTTTYNAKVAEIQATTDGITSSVSATNSKIDNLQIGGRNYYKMKSFQGAGGTTAVFDDTNQVWNVTIPSGSTTSWRGISYNAKNAILRVGRTYTVSFEVYADSVIPLYADINNQGLTTNVGVNDNDVTSKRIYNFPSTVAGRWTKASFTFTMPDTITQDFYDYSTLGVANGWTPSANTTIKIKNMKLEEGNKATDWQPAVEDMNDSFDALDQSISTVDQKADGIQSSVTSLTTTVNSQGTRLTNAETTITQHTNSINLKADASTVYTKSQVDSSLSQKVDTTTYNNKMSSIDVSINGINQTVSDQSTSISGLNGTVTNHTSQISSVQQQADGISTTVTQVQSDLSGLTGRVSTAETNISQNTSAIALKASQSSVDSLGTRVTSAEGTLSVQAGQIASKVAQTTYDSAVGVNKWVASRFDMNLGSSSVIPTFDHIKGKTPSSVIDYADNANLDAFDGDYYMTHYFTNVYMNTAKTVSLTVTNDDGASIFLNGASIYGKGSSTTATSVSVAFRAGWNTLEILHYEHSGSEKVSLGVSISSQVDKMTSVVGVGNKNETRLTQAETSIIQTTDAIALKADSTTVTALGNRVTTNEGSITLLNNQIASKVAQSDFDAYSQRLSTAESNITQNTNSIATKVAQSDFDNLNGRVTTAESSITQLNNSITLKATQSSVDSLTGRVTTAEGTLTTQAGQIATKVSQSSFDALKVGGRNIVLGTATPKTATGTGGTNQSTNIYNLSSNYSYSSIAGKEVTISFDMVSSVSSGTAIIQWNNTPWGYLSGSVPVSTTKQHIVKTVTQPASGSATGVQVRLDNVTGTVTISNLKIEVGNRATDYTVAPEDTDATISAIDGRLSTAETTITQNSNSISLKANSSDVYTKAQTDSAISGSVNSAKADITLTTDSISSSVSSLQSIVANNSQQLIRNSMFVDGTNNASYWTLGTGWAVDTSKAVDGANAMLNTTTGLSADAWRSLISENVDIKAGQKLNGSWYTMIDDTTLDEGRGYSLEIEYLNSTGARVTVVGKSVKPTAINTWQRFDLTSTAPTGAVKARLRVYPTRNGKIWVSRPMLVLGDTVPSAFGLMPSESVLKGMDASITTLNNSITSKVTQTDINNSISALKINERNLLYNSTGKLSDDNNQALGWATNTFVDVVDGKPALRVNNSSTTETTRSSRTIAVKPSTSYVLKGLVKGTSNNKGYDIFWLGKKSGSANSFDYTYNLTGSKASTTALTATNELIFTTKSDEVSGFIRIDNNGTDGTTYKADDGVTDISDSTVWFSEIIFQEGTKGTSWSPAPEDLYDQIDDAYARISSAEEKITADAIINTVSTTIQNAVEGKADASDLAGYATSGDLDDAVAQMGSDVDAKIGALDYVTPSVLATELDQTNQDFEFKIQQSGGVNLIKNSVGFAEIADSPVWVLNGTVNTIQSDELDQLGFGSGFYVPNGVAGYIDQSINVTAGETYTLSFYLKKTIDNASNGWAGIDVYDNGTKLTFQGLGAGAGTTTDGYQQFTYTFTPTVGKLLIHVTVGSASEAIITGLMLNVGEHPRQWSMANGEVYNTNVKVDINGIKVLSNQYEGFTSISPEEFAGYASVADETTGVATMTKVFTLNKDVTEMSKVDIDKEIAMNPIRVIPIQSGSNNGWAFLPSV
ncbi:carbohydrate binding domain-containing protein [Priestia megaterium]|uniref:carbohydrate binding domain-containing protein n=1 Tax=Priestia megaterium TaxID=1404 RepID=UPI002FFE28AB